jgi:pilus assembly protein CpaC
MKRFLIIALLITAATPALARPTVLSLTVDHGIPLTLAGPAASVFVANPDIADVQVMAPNQVMIFGKRTGETSFMATDSKGGTLAERTIVVSQDLAELRVELDAAIPGNLIKAAPVPNGIVLTGQAKDPTAVADAYKIAMRFMPTGGDIINRVQVAGSNQVQIRVRFAEVQKSIDNTLGFNWQNLTNVGGFALGLATGNAVLAQGTGTFNSGADNNMGLFPRPNNTTLNLPNDVAGFSHQGSRSSINGMIDALAQDGLVTILAEPTLTAMSGETANFLAGGEFPIPIPQGNGTISITFKSYGISLDFTPTLLSGDRISLHVRPEVSELTDTGAIVLNNITVPALTTRKAETTVEVASGESFAIAGLMDNSQTQTINKYPLLGDMPILGALFRSDHFQNGQTELMVIITPYVVKPTPNKLALPTDGYSPPNENERLIGLRSSSGDPDARPMSGDPTAVVAPNEAIVPANAPPVKAAPVTPVLSAPSSAATSAPSITNEQTPVILTPPPTLPLVLHPASDKGDQGGGILVE